MKDSQHNNDAYCCSLVGACLVVVYCMEQPSLKPHRATSQNADTSHVLATFSGNFCFKPTSCGIVSRTDLLSGTRDLSFSQDLLLRPVSGPPFATAFLRASSVNLVSWPCRTYSRVLFQHLPSCHDQRRGGSRISACLILVTALNESCEDRDRTIPPESGFPLRHGGRPPRPQDPQNSRQEPLHYALESSAFMYFGAGAIGARYLN